VSDMTPPDALKKRPWAGEKKAIKPRPITISEEGMVELSRLEGGGPLPLVMRPAVSMNLAAWAGRNRDFVESNLLRHGAILFRDFRVGSVEEFGEFTRALSGEPMEYRERSSPRHEVGDRVYTSTDYPAGQSIFPHNEHSYSLRLPLKLLFFCLEPAERGGETPIADCRKIYRRLDPRIRERFARKGYVYVRNFGEGFGVPWQTAFQTEDRGAVEEYCRRNLIEFKWKEGDRLLTRQVRPAAARHPRTGEMVWFNHATFFHVSTLEPTIRDGLLAAFEERDLPNNTYYGDGSPIEPSVLDELRRAYLEELVSFEWREGDVLLIDNMLTAHSRRPYTGPRKILVAMTDPYVRPDF